MLKKVHKFHLEIELVSGMHITGSDDTFDIGGADSQVIKNPLTGEPYIPGSSLKGKIRSLLEYKYGKIKGDGDKKTLEVLEEHQNCLCLFEPRDEFLPKMTRGIFRDLLLKSESKKQLEDTLGHGVYTEIKAENKINRFQGKAESPRFIERVPAGVKFEGEIDVLEFDEDNYEKLKEYLIEAFDLLQLNYIGGSGSRGYGQVKVKWQEEVD